LPRSRNEETHLASFVSAQQDSVLVRRFLRAKCNSNHFIVKLSRPAATVPGRFRSVPRSYWIRVSQRI